MVTKRCGQCRENLGLDNFRNNNNGKYGKRGSCKSCENTKLSKYRSKNKESLSKGDR